MEIKTIYEDKRVAVKMMWVYGSLWCTETVYLDELGFVKSSVKVFADGYVTIEKNGEEEMYHV